MFGFDRGPNIGKPDGPGIADKDIIGLDALEEKGNPGEGAGGNAGGVGNGNGNYDKNAGNGGGKSGKAKKDSEKTEEEKFNEFLVQSQRDLVQETLDFDSKVYPVLGEVNENFSFQSNLIVEPAYDSQNAHYDFSKFNSVGSSYIDAQSEHLTRLAKLEKADFQSDKKEKLNTVRKQLLSKAPRSPQQHNAKAAGLLSLQYSDMAYVKAQTGEGDFYYEMAVQLAGIVTDLIPVTALAKDVYGLVVGKDLLTGEELSAFERSLCGTFALAQIAGALYTAGIGTSMVAAGIKQIRNIAKAEANAVRLSVKLAKIAEKIPHRTSVVLPGHSKSVALIGRNMDNVRAMKAALEKENVIVKIFDGPAVSEKAASAWNKAKEAAKALGQKIPDHEIVKMDIFKENKEWIENMAKEGHTILDAGNSAGQDWSIFYEMEKIIIERMKQAGAK